MRSISDLALFLRDANGMYATLHQFSGDRPILSVSLFDDVVEAARELWTCAEEDVHGVTYTTSGGFGGVFHYRVRVAEHRSSYTFAAYARGGRESVGKWWALESRPSPAQRAMALFRRL